MISFLKGEVVTSNENTIEMDVNGVGFEIISTSGAILKYSVNSKQVTIPTYMQVREDGVFLFGFKDNNEKQMFLKLITVSGVGPKLAVTILSSISDVDLCLAIATEDVKAMSKIKGLGKKTAEKIILELREKVGTIDTNNVALPLMASFVDPGAVEDASLALQSLGLSSSDALKLASKMAADGDTAEDIIKKCLKDMAR